MPRKSYSSGSALERAIRDIARNRGLDVGKALEDYYVDRFLARVFSDPYPIVVIKGGRAVLARVEFARRTKDIDMVIRGDDLNSTIARLAELGRKDLGDFLTYELDDGGAIAEGMAGRSGRRLILIPYTDHTKRHGNIHIDLVEEAVPLELVDVVKPKHQLTVGDMPVYDWLVYPVEYAVADKVCATLELFNGRESSRVRDLVDLVTYLLREDMRGDVLTRRLEEQMCARGLRNVREFSVPTFWFESYGPSYRRGIAEAHIPAPYGEMEKGEQLVKSCVDPVLAGDLVSLKWSHAAVCWI